MSSQSSRPADLVKRAKKTSQTRHTKRIKMYRFAPSPTGDMHIGNLRAALINYVCSLQDKSGFIVRIEDTDKERNIAGKDAEILAILKEFGMSYQTLYYQSKNLKFHQEFAAKLLESGKAFLCFCDEASLEAKKEQGKNITYIFTMDSKDECTYELVVEGSMDIEEWDRFLSVESN